MNTNPKVYLIAKVSGLSRNEVKEKYASVRELIESYGYEAVIPIEHVRPDAEWHEAMKICRERLNAHTTLGIDFKYCFFKKKWTK